MASRAGPRQAVDLIDNDDVDLPGADVLQQSLQIGTVGRPTRVSPIVIAGPDQGPAGMGLAFDIGGGSIVLRIQRVELLVEPVLSGDPGIDRAADRSDGWSLHDRAASGVDPSYIEADTFGWSTPPWHASRGTLRGGRNHTGPP